MACFLVSAAEAAIVTAVEKHAEKKELPASADTGAVQEPVRIPLSTKLKWLNRLLIGGAVLLMFEHIWHGEVVPWFPFLTAMADAADTAEMLHEMATTGVCMAVLVTAVWFIMCKAADAIVRRDAEEDVGQTATTEGRAS